MHPGQPGRVSRTKWLLLISVGASAWASDEIDDERGVCMEVVLLGNRGAGVILVARLVARKVSRFEFAGS